MDYFMDVIALNIRNSTKRLTDERYVDSVWSKARVVDFLENNLGLSKKKKIKGRIVKDHNEALLFWKELIENKILQTPFEVVHVDSHADLGNYYSSWRYILDELLLFEFKKDHIIILMLIVMAKRKKKE